MATDMAPVKEADTAASTPDIRLTGVRKVYGDVVAVDGVDLDIHVDEFFTLLGPSGSGKTTCLRMIAGFGRPLPGPGPARGGQDALPAHDRRVRAPRRRAGRAGRPRRHRPAAVRARRQHR